MNRKKSPEIIDVVPAIPSNPDKKNIKGKFPLYLFPDPTTDIFKFEIILNAGLSYDKQPLIPDYTGAMLAEGTQTMTAEEISEAFDYYGAYYQQETGRDVAYIQVFAPVRHAIPVLDLVFDLFTRPAFPLAQLRQMVTLRKEQYHVDKQKVKYLAAEAFMSNLFGSDHPYGNTIKEEDFDKPTIKQLEDFHQRFYHVGNVKMILAGNIQKNMTDYIEEVFGSLKPGKEVKRPQYKMAPKKKKEVYIPVENAVQSAIRTGFPTINKLHPDYPLLQLLSTILGGYFGSRLMRNVREDKGYSYGIGSAALSLKDSGYFMIVSEVGADVCSLALTEIYKEVELLITTPVDEKELQTVKKYLAGEFIRMFDGAIETSAAWRAADDFDMDFSYFKNYLKAMMKATPAQLQKTAARYLNRENFHEIVAGKK